MSGLQGTFPSSVTLYLTGAAWDELPATFPYPSTSSIDGKIRRLGVSRTRSPKLLGVPLIHAGRSRASALGFSLTELDREVGAKGNFSEGEPPGLTTPSRVSAPSLARASRRLAFPLMPVKAADAAPASSVEP
jgi:hypothetical protein